MTSVEAFLLALACQFGGLAFGYWLRRRLPAEELLAEKRDVVRLAITLIATMTAMVLGLLLAGAKSTYDAQYMNVTHLASDTVRMDMILHHYGPDADHIRKQMRPALAVTVERIWGRRTLSAGGDSTDRYSDAADSIFDLVTSLEPRNAAQTQIKTLAVGLYQDFMATRLMIDARNFASLPLPLFILVLFWMATIFASYTLCADVNRTVIAALAVCALSVSGGLFLLFELSQPFSGLFAISDVPLTTALEPLPG